MFLQAETSGLRFFHNYIASAKKKKKKKKKWTALNQQNVTSCVL